METVSKAQAQHVGVTLETLGILAEGVGFEPTVQLPARLISRHADTTW